MALSLRRYSWSGETGHLAQLLKQRIKFGKQRSMLIAMGKINDLPESLIIEILSRLPVKDLLQFKSVCKSWYAIISSPNFVSNHLSNYYNNNDDWRGCLLVQDFITHAEIELVELLVDETPQVLASDNLHGMPMRCSFLCGPCDGLYYVYQYDGRRALWNPAINEFKLLPDIICKPDLPTHFTYSSYEVFGFGFDHVSRDYKVVVMKGYWEVNPNNKSDLNHPVSVLVYSLRTESWRYCGDLSKAYDLEMNYCYIYVNECCYWLGSQDYSSEVMISFDMTSDSFKEFNIPDYAQPSFKCLAVYDDSLVLLSLHETKKNFDIWTWSEGGCWTKKFTLGPLPDVWIPVGHWKCNMLILQCEDGTIFLFDPDTQERKDLGFKISTMCRGVFAYMESLVSIKDKTEAGQRQSQHN
ncbi:putative F-box protein At3g51171 [Apium graveolens]|uniref:putative F-box protein At3g51171 n=1 Tax=Apium graveolens TaxID=4045 RepID=UPI003D78E512